MTAAFRTSLTSLLPASEDAVSEYLNSQSEKHWLSLAELFAARLPEFDVVLAFPDSLALARQVAQIRGVPVLLAHELPDGVRLESAVSGEKAPSGEAALITIHLRSGDAVMQALAAAQEQGLNVSVIGAAVERTSLGARSRVAQQGVIVRAAMQIADTPGGLNVERRNPDRWTASV